MYLLRKMFRWIIGLVGRVWIYIIILMYVYHVWCTQVTLLKNYILTYYWLFHSFQSATVSKAIRLHHIFTDVASLDNFLRFTKNYHGPNSHCISYWSVLDQCDMLWSVLKLDQSMFRRKKKFFFSTNIAKKIRYGWSA